MGAATVPSAPAQDIFVTPIAGVPFSGVVNVERSMVQPDGSVVTLQTRREIGRDGRGRIHNEARTFVPVSSSDTPQIITIHLYDPQTRISTMLSPVERTFQTTTVNRPPATVPPALRASATGNTLPQSDFTKEEDLGIHEIEGFAAHGVREIQTIPPENDQARKEIAITDEYWYSEELRINLMVKHSDPRTGTVTLRVGQITRTEPDPLFFQVPGGYKPAGGGEESAH